MLLSSGQLKAGEVGVTAADDDVDVEVLFSVVEADPPAAVA